MYAEVDIHTALAYRVLLQLRSLSWKFGTSVSHSNPNLWCFDFRWFQKIPCDYLNRGYDITKYTEILCSWDRASFDMEIIYVTKQMQLLIIFIDNNALHVSGVSRPSSGARKLCVQPLVLACWSM